MSKYYYEVPVDSETGKRISLFWQRCIKADEAQADYLKKMGAADMCLEPANYFAGGVAAVSFAEGKKVDTGVWRKAKEEDGIQYWEPNCECRSGEVEIPSRDYQVKDTVNRMYLRDQINEREMSDTEDDETADGGEPVMTKRLFIPYLEFYRNEPEGHSGRTGNPRQASRGLRKAIKAEMRRLRLPVVRPDELLMALRPNITGRLTTTPTFFTFHSRYFIGIDFDCSDNPELTPISLQQYNMSKGRAQLEAKRGWS